MPLTQDDIDGIYNKVRGFYANEKIRENPDDPNSPVVGRKYNLKSSNIRYGNPTSDKHAKRNTNAQTAAFRLSELRAQFRNLAAETLEEEARRVGIARERLRRIGGEGTHERVAAEMELKEALSKGFEGQMKLQAEYGAWLVHHGFKLGNCQEQSAVTLFEALSDPQFASKLHNAYVMCTSPPANHILVAFSDGPDKPVTGMKLSDFNASNTRGLWIIDPQMKFPGPAPDYVDDAGSRLVAWGDKDHGTKGFLPVDKNANTLPVSEYNPRQYAHNLFNSSLVVTEIPKLLLRRFVQMQQTRSEISSAAGRVAIQPPQKRQQVDSPARGSTAARPDLPDLRPQPNIDNLRGAHQQQEPAMSPSGRAGIEERPAQQHDRMETQRKRSPSRGPAR